MTIENQFKLALKSIALAQSGYDLEIANLIRDWRLIRVSNSMNTSKGRAFDSNEITIGSYSITSERLLTWSFLNQCLVKIPTQYGSFINIPETPNTKLLPI